MSEPRQPLRLRLAAIALAVPILVLVLDVAAGVLSPNHGLCSIDVFGLQFPSTGTVCYIPIGNTVVFLTAIVVLGLAIRARPRRMVRFAAVPAALLFLPDLTRLLQQYDPFTVETVRAGVLGAIPFALHPPTGPDASRLARGSWILLLVVLGALATLDTLFSGFFQSGTTELQFSYAFVALAIAAAGWVSGRWAASPDAQPATS